MSTRMAAVSGGPLKGLRVLEIAGIGPGPFCSMVLADLGADVLRVEAPTRSRGGVTDAPALDLVERSRTVLQLDLKSDGGRAELLEAAEHCDVLLEGFRPGTMERLGLGPDELLTRNPRIVYGRITGWGQEGPLAHTAGHDINYIALTGVLSMIGEPDSAPLPPLNYVGDYGGGGMLLAVGVLAAIWEATRSGMGQVVDAAMVDGSTLLSTLFYSLRATGRLQDERGSNLLDGGAPFYSTYRTKDEKYMALGALEQPFYEEFARLAGISPIPVLERLDPRSWPEQRAQLRELFGAGTRAEWSDLFAGSDACCTPVLTLDEAAHHPHLKQRSTILVSDGVAQPAPAPRFGRTPTTSPTAPGEVGDARRMLRSWRRDTAVLTRHGASVVDRG